MEERVTKPATTLTFTQYAEAGTKFASNVYDHLVGTEFKMVGLLSSVAGKLIKAEVHESGKYVTLTIEAPVYRAWYDD